MKLTLFLTIICLQVSAGAFSQRINLSVKNAQLGDILHQLSRQSGLPILYDNKDIKKEGNVTIDLKNTTVDDALTQLLADKNLSYTIVNQTVVIKTKTEPSFIDKIKEAITAIDVHGRVVDENDVPLAGATVIVKETNNSTLTGNNGDFILKNVQPGVVIVIRYIGFDMKEVKAAEYVGNVKLSVTDNKLDEVRVQAYGITSTRTKVSNSDGITAKEIESQPVSNPLIALQGRVPGIQINQVSGLPGDGVQVRIQGATSFSAGTDPFYVVDGVPYNNSTPAAANVNVFGKSNSNAQAGQTSLMPNTIGSPINYINPNDIESIEVLKDAVATAIYGSKAANGAIIITTKRGKPGETKVELTGSYGISQVKRRYDLLNAQQFLDMRLEAKRNANQPITTSDYDLNGTWDKGQDANLQNELFGRTATNNIDHLTISGGSTYTNYLIGTSYSRVTTMVPGDFSDKTFSSHFNINSRTANNKFNIQLTGSYLIDNNNLQTYDVSGVSLYSPLYPKFVNSDGTLNWVYNSSGSVTNTNNAFGQLRNIQYLNNSALVANMQLKYNIISGLDIKTSFGYNLNRNDFNSQQKASSLFPPNNTNPAQNTSTFSQGKTSTFIIEPQLSYYRNLLGGDLNLLLGGTIQQQTSGGYRVQGSGYVSEELLGSLAGASSYIIYNNSGYNYKYNAVFARVTYNYQNKYIIELNARRDGSSRFGPQNRFQSFGAAGLGWVFTEEKFLKFPKWFSLGKLRASFGTTGNDQIGDYTYLDLYQSANVGLSYGGLTSFTPVNLPTPNLQWELTKKYNVGFDLGFLHDRILFTANYSINRSSNFLLTSLVPSISGFQSLLQNFPGLIQNNIYELGISSTNLKLKDFKWTTNFNVTIPKQTLKSLPAKTALQIALYQSGTFIVGQPLNIKRVYHFLGVDPATGVDVVADANGNPTTAPSGTDGTVLLNLESPYYGGLSNSITYREFQLDFFLQYVKQLKQRFLYNQLTPGANLLYNQPISVLDRWQHPGDVTYMEKFYSSSGAGIATNRLVSATDEYYQDASYLRLKNVQLAWMLRGFTLQKSKIQSLKIYIQAQNLMTFTRFSGLDPETGSTMPPLRTIVLGAQITF